MRHFKPLSPIFLSSLIVVSFVFALSPSCRKLKDVEMRPDNELVQKFFQVPEDASYALRSVIADIKKQEDKYHFVNQLSGKYGLPAWGKSIANVPIRNIPNTINTRSATGDSLQVFLIPFRASDSSVSSYLVCARNGNDFTYRYYKKDNLSALYAANDTIEHVRESLLSVFGYFEKSINNNDSTFIAGIYNKFFSEVEIKINGIPVNARTANAGLSLIEVCYSVSNSTGPQQRSQIVPAIQCIVIGVYGSMIDLGFTSSNGYSSGGSGGGSGGGGSSGGNTFPDGFQCPQSEWWCESGDYRFVDGVLYTPLAYPGQINGLPWLWWENSLWIDNNLGITNSGQSSPWLFDHIERTVELHSFINAAYSDLTLSDKRVIANDHLNLLMTDSDYLEMVEAYATENAIHPWMLYLFKELAIEVAWKVIKKYIPGYGDWQSIKDAIEQGRKGNWLEMLGEVFNLVKKRVPWTAFFDSLIDTWNNSKLAVKTWKVFNKLTSLPSSFSNGLIATLKNKCSEMLGKFELDPISFSGHGRINFDPSNSFSFFQQLASDVGVSYTTFTTSNGTGGQFTVSGFTIKFYPLSTIYTPPSPTLEILQGSTTIYKIRFQTW